MTSCQSCNSDNLSFVVSLGHLPPPNDYRPLGEAPVDQLWMPTDLVYCRDCELVQLAYAAEPHVVFPLTYPYTSGTTKQLRDNFADLASKVYQNDLLPPGGVIVDIGSNDGTLLSNFCNRNVVRGIEPTNTAAMANANGIKTYQSYFGAAVVDQVLHDTGPVDVVTCANCFAHMPRPNLVLQNISRLLKPGGMFISESHYLIDLLDKVHYDTIYHEHLRYYSVTSLQNLLDRHGFHVFHAERIPTHGGSIRVYASKDRLPLGSGIGLAIHEPKGSEMLERLTKFAGDVANARLTLWQTLATIKQLKKRIVGISAPSRAATIVNYCRLDASIIDYVVEVDGSLKLGHYMPGTDIPVVREDRLFAEQPDYAVMFSHHIGGTIIDKLKAKGYEGQFLHPISFSRGWTSAEAA